MGAVEDSKARTYPDWQSKKTLAETNRYMLENEVATDVRFIVGKEMERIPAHRYMLVSRSSVFYAMFYGVLAEKNEVVIPDIAPDVFRMLLRFLYLEEVNITPNNVLEIRYAALKYLVPALAERCREFLVENLDVENVFTVLNHAVDILDLDLTDQCLAFIAPSVEDVLNGENFLTISRSALAVLLNCDALCSGEDVLIQACERWANFVCKERGIAYPTGQQQREALGECFRLIRNTYSKQQTLGVATNPLYTQCIDHTRNRP
ncbi:BTB/POZ domain-containing protein 6-like [Lingula anatina]|uniref:BTB/POZ domain-containing protein 6-like n=1 Tax=Lingula anatina TaxID=7574 RepID=A0A2R2MNL5_LINAN|nr:BTB/POZ domain-containing protein 6-like [Lingula anatina]|eukprot:XP_023931637.1 BTB/POZ domain-containing protein 6-like [Lingula anatina]